MDSSYISQFDFFLFSVFKFAISANATSFIDVAAADEIYRVKYSFFLIHSIAIDLGDSLLGLFKSQAVPSSDGQRRIRVDGRDGRRITKHGSSGCRPFASAVGHHRIETPFQHVHVPGIVGSSAHLFGCPCGPPDRLRTAGFDREDSLPIHPRRRFAPHALRPSHA